MSIALEVQECQKGRGCPTQAFFSLEWVPLVEPGSNSKRAGLNCEKLRSDRSCVRNDSAALSVFSFGTLVFFRGLKGAISFYRYIKPRVVPDGTLRFFYFAYPALKRWAMLFRAYGARACVVPALMREPGSAWVRQAALMRARFLRLMRWRAWVVGD